MDAPMDLMHDQRKITPHTARRMRDTMRYPRQRFIREENVKRLAREMARQRFIPGTQCYIAVLPDGKHWILNGNHTLEAIAMSGESQMMLLTYKTVSSEEEADRIYAVFDIHKTRTWYDSLRATGQAEGMTLAPQVLAAIGMIENRFEQVSRPHLSSRIDRLELLEEYRDAAELFAAARARSRSRDAAKLPLRAGIMSVALETLRYNPSAACDFWEDLMQDEGLKTGNPAKTLLTWLRNIKNTGGSQARAEHARAAALAWNAFFRNRTLHYVKPNSMGAFYLVGTPWEKGLKSADDRKSLFNDNGDRLAAGA